MIPELTVLENMALGAQLRGHKDALSSMQRLDRTKEQSLLREAARQLDRIGMGHTIERKRQWVNINNPLLLSKACALVSAAP